MSKNEMLTARKRKEMKRRETEIKLNGTERQEKGR
jgi:hypothetical protein